MLDPGRNPGTHEVLFSQQNYYCRGGADDHGTDTPPLWRASPPQPESINYRCLSPASKAEAIARGQKELMEMVGRMPESCYELSLKDLVEQPLVNIQKRNEQEVNFRRDEMKRRSDEMKIRANRSGRYENHNGGLFLKTVIPVYVGINRSNRKKNQQDLGNSNNPKAAAAKDWWKKRSTESSGSESIRSSTRSKSSGSSNSSSRNSNTSRRHEQGGGGCWSFLTGRSWRSKRSSSS